MRGLISMTTTRPVRGSCANCTLVPPMTSMASTIRYAYSWSRACSSGAMVSIGAVQYESPVCTPIASTFSMKQTVIFCPFASRTTSSSSSSQPSTDSSTRTCETGLAARPRETISSSSSTL